MPKSNYGKGNQNVTPSWVSWNTRKDGKEQAFYGKDGGGSQHGHGVRGRDGNVDYSRTIGGKVVHDNKRK